MAARALKHKEITGVKHWKFAVVLALLGSSVMAEAQSLPQVKVGASKDYVAVLMWHDVVAGQKEVWFDTTVAELKTQFGQIQKRKFNVISMETLVKHLTEGTPLPIRPLVLTFDDNNLGLYTNAYPLLKQFHYPATFFVHTDFVGVTTSKAHCTWEQLKEMQSSGLVTVQGHTCSHPADMRQLPDVEIGKELRNSLATITRHLGTKVIAFAYPEGKYDDRVARAVAQSGYKIAFTEDWGNAGASRNLMVVHRYSIHKRFAQSLNDVERAWQGRH